jgi:iron complex outermembrane receptor protein
VSPISVRTTEYDMNRNGALGSADLDAGRPHDRGRLLVRVQRLQPGSPLLRQHAPDAALDAGTSCATPLATQWSYAYDFETTMFYIQDTWDITDDLTVFGGFKSVTVDMAVDTNIAGFTAAGGRAPTTISTARSRRKTTSCRRSASPTQLADNSEIFGGYTENMRAHTLAPAASQTQSGFDFIKDNTDPESSKTTEARLALSQWPVPGRCGGLLCEVRGPPARPLLGRGHHRQPVGDQERRQRDDQGSRTCRLV